MPTLVAKYTLFPLSCRNKPTRKRINQDIDIPLARSRTVFLAKGRNWIVRFTLLPVVLDLP
jgi:hypothetical protein